MDPSLLPQFVAPILIGKADYTKGNRFYDLNNISRMPALRIVGNAVLSFMAKLSTSYPNIFDPTNGYTTVHAKVAAHLPLEKISRRYFFESDLLFRLITLRAVVVDIPNTIARRYLEIFAEVGQERNSREDGSSQEHEDWISQYLLTRVRDAIPR